MADVVQSEQGLFLVMEYVHGESLSRLMRTARATGEPIPPRIVAAIMCGVLLGLHSAHDTRGHDGALLGVVHRDVSPQNVIVGADGSARVLDFGIAKAAGRVQVTREGQIKGKLAYMAPEQLRGRVDRRTDVFAASVVLWEMLTGRRLHEGAKDVEIVTRVVKGDFAPPSAYSPGLGPELDAIVLRGLAVDPDQRFASARDLALELERRVGLASPSEVSAWVERLASDVLHARANLVSAMERVARDLVPIASNRPGPAEPIVSPPSFGSAALPPARPSDHNLNESSSSAVFAHAQAAEGAQSTSPLGRPLPMIWWMLAVSVVMAIVGITLGTCAMLRRSARVEPAPNDAPGTSTPPGASSPSSRATSPSSPPMPSAASLPPTPAGNEAAAPRSSSLMKTAPLPAAAGKPSVAPLAPSTRSTDPLPECDPPFVLDAQGHRHYKSDCD